MGVKKAGHTDHAGSRSGKILRMIFFASLSNSKQWNKLTPPANLGALPGAMILVVITRN